jgi:hypothetical protein
VKRPYNFSLWPSAVAVLAILAFALLPLGLNPCLYLAHGADVAVRPTAAVARPWECTVRIHVDLGNGASSYGSGTVVRSGPEASLVATCAHIFADASNRYVHPRQFRRKVGVDLFDGAAPPRAPAMTATLEGFVLGYDSGRDVGFVEIRPGKALPASGLAPASYRPSPGELYVAVGSPHGNAPVAHETRYVGPFHQTVSGAPLYGCDHRVEGGRSGGGLHRASDGVLVGVLDFGEPDKPGAKGPRSQGVDVTSSWGREDPRAVAFYAAVGNLHAVAKEFRIPIEDEPTAAPERKPGSNIKPPGTPVEKPAVEVSPSDVPAPKAWTLADLKIGGYDATHIGLGAVATVFGLGWLRKKAGEILARAPGARAEARSIITHRELTAEEMLATFLPAYKTALLRDDAGARQREEAGAIAKVIQAAARPTSSAAAHPAAAP